MELQDGWHDAGSSGEPAPERPMADVAAAFVRGMREGRSYAERPGEAPLGIEVRRGRASAGGARSRLVKHVGGT